MSILDILWPMPGVVEVCVLDEAPWKKGAPTTRTWSYYDDVPRSWLRFADTWGEDPRYIKREDCPQCILDLQPSTAQRERYIVMDWDWPTLDGVPLGHWIKA